MEKALENYVKESTNSYEKINMLKALESELSVKEKWELQ